MDIETNVRVILNDSKSIQERLDALVSLASRFNTLHYFEQKELVVAMLKVSGEPNSLGRQTVVCLDIFYPNHPQFREVIRERLAQIKETIDKDDIRASAIEEFFKITVAYIESQIRKHKSPIGYTDWESGIIYSTIPFANSTLIGLENVPSGAAPCCCNWRKNDKTYER